MTMAPRPARHQYSYDEYLAYERDSGLLVQAVIGPCSGQVVLMQIDDQLDALVGSEDQ